MAGGAGSRAGRNHRRPRGAGSHDAQPCPDRPSGRAPAGRAPCPVLWRVFRSRRDPSAVLAGVAGMARPRRRGDRLRSGRRVLAAHRHQPSDPRRLRSARRTPAADDCAHRRDPCRPAPVRLGAGFLAAPVAQRADRRHLGRDPAARRSRGARRGAAPRSELWPHPALGLDRLHPGRDRDRAVAGGRRPGHRPLVDCGRGRLPPRGLHAAAGRTSARASCGVCRLSPPGGHARVPGVRRGRRR